VNAPVEFRAVVERPEGRDVYNVHVLHYEEAATSELRPDGTWCPVPELGSLRPYLVLPGPVGRLVREAFRNTSGTSDGEV